MKRGKIMGSFLAISCILGLLLAVPVAIQAGQLEPPGPPGPTMKTLDEIPPTWSRVLPESDRFQLVMGGNAVLDMETGLVWDRSPGLYQESWSDAYRWMGGVQSSVRRSYGGAQIYCASLFKGNRYGWRMPSLDELTSVRIYDPSNGTVGLSPYFNIIDYEDGIWTSTPNPYNPDENTFFVWSHPNRIFVSTLPNTSSTGVWCVRGGFGSGK